MRSATSSPAAPPAKGGGLAGLAGVGPQTAERFAQLGVATPADLLAYVPRTYRDWRTPQPIASLREGEAEAIVVGRVTAVRERPGFGGRGRRGPLPSVTVELADESGSIAAV